MQARYEVQQKYSISATDIQHFNLNICFGLLSNTVSVVPWVLFYIYSRPSLLEASRIAVSHYIHTSKNNNSNNSAGVAARDQHYRADIAAIAAGCPLLASVFQETLRVQSTNAQGRVVLKDTLLNGQYVLKKDSVVLIPSAELHNNASIWGASCKEFDPLRFTVPGGNNHNNHKGQHGAKKFIPPGQAAYRAFGGGAHLCPGRFLAENQTMIIVVIMLLRYDLVPAAGRWVLPECRPHISATILMPTEDIQVRIEERRGYENARWEFTWGGGDGGETTRA